MIASCIGKKLHLFLGDGDVIAVSQMLANMCHEICLVLDDGCHVLSVADQYDQMRTSGYGLVKPDFLVRPTLVMQKQCTKRDIKDHIQERIWNKRSMNDEIGNKRREGCH